MEMNCPHKCFVMVLLGKQAYKVLGHIDILGDPLSLGKSISSGVIGFVTKVRPTWPHTYIPVVFSFFSPNIYFGKIQPFHFTMAAGVN